MVTVVKPETMLTVPLSDIFKNFLVQFLNNITSNPSNQIFQHFLQLKLVYITTGR